jgi:hypothetical protein
MPRRKKRYMVPPTPVPTSAPVAPDPLPLPYCFDLRSASQYSSFSVYALRQAITTGELPVANRKPYLIRRKDLEEWVNRRVQVIPPRIL